MKITSVTMLTLIIILISFTTFNAESAAFTDQKIKFNLPSGWALGEVAAIERKKNGHFIVFHRGQHSLLEFDSSYDFVKEIGHGLFKNPHGLRLDKEENIWTTDSGTHVVLRFSDKGEVTMVLGRNNTAGTGWFDRDYNLVMFNQPLDVAFDTRNNIYVVDKGNARIVKLDPNGMLINTWGQSGTNIGEFKFAHSIVIDKNNLIYVADRENKRIQLFNTDGKALSQWNDVGYPYVLFLKNETLWMTDARAEQVKAFNLNGVFLDKYQGAIGRNPGQFSSVHGIYVDSDDTIWVTQIFNWGGINKLRTTH